MTKTNNPKTFKVSLIAALGSAIEYYDFVVYGLMSSYLSTIFFENNDEYSQLIKTFLIFAIGYFARPLGGIIGGIISDNYGRKITFMIVSVQLLARPRSLRLV